LTSYAVANTIARGIFERYRLTNDKLKRSIEVSIMGQHYRLVSESGADHMAEVANLVNRKVEEFERAGKSLTTHKTAILVALNFADEYLKAVKRERRIRATVEERLSRVLEAVESQIAT
jgi:cell division protein ZapA